MANLTIVANIHAKADKVDLIKAELQKLIGITRSEEGCTSKRAWASCSRCSRSCARSFLTYA